MKAAIPISINAMIANGTRIPAAITPAKQTNNNNNNNNNSITLNDCVIPLDFL